MKNLLQFKDCIKSEVKPTAQTKENGDKVKEPFLHNRISKITGISSLWSTRRYTTLELV